MKPMLVALALGFVWVSPFVACIEVGHEAETGCLKDPALPGCKAPTSSGTSSGNATNSGGTTTSSSSSGSGGTSSEGGAAGAPNNSSDGAQAGAGAE